MGCIRDDPGLLPMTVAIVGGGVGGLACAQRLARRARGSEVVIQLIDRTLRHDFAPSFPWLITGSRQPERVSRSLAGLERVGIKLIHTDVEGIDLDRDVLATSACEVAFDELVLAPGAALAPEVVPGLPEAGLGFYTRDKPPTTDLSARERQVLSEIALGATNREIGERLYLSPHTIKEHSNSLYRKLGVRNRAEAVKRAQGLGLIG